MAKPLIVWDLSGVLVFKDRTFRHFPHYSQLDIKTCRITIAPKLAQCFNNIQKKTNARFGMWSSTTYRNVRTILDAIIEDQPEMKNIIDSFEFLWTRNKCRRIGDGHATEKPASFLKDCNIWDGHSPLLFVDDDISKHRCNDPLNVLILPSFQFTLNDIQEKRISDLFREDTAFYKTILPEAISTRILSDNVQRPAITMSTTSSSKSAKLFCDEDQTHPICTDELLESAGLSDQPRHTSYARTDR